MTKLAFGKNTMQQCMGSLKGTLGAGRSKAIVNPRGTFMKIRQRYTFSKYFDWKIFILLILL